MEITVHTDDPKNIIMMYKVKAAFDAKPLQEPPLDELVLSFSCESEPDAPVMRYKINDSEEVQSIKIRELKFIFPTTFFPMPESIACVVGNEVVRINGQASQKARRIVSQQFGKRDIAVPPKVYKEALNEAIVLNSPSGSIEIKGDFKTRDLADVLGIEPQSVRYHLRNLLNEGVDIGKENRWETDEEFQRICNLIKPRLGAHGRRA